MREPRDNRKGRKGCRDEQVERNSQRRLEEASREVSENSRGHEKMKPVGVDNIFKRFSCEGEEQDIRGMYVKLI